MSKKVEQHETQPVKARRGYARPSLTKGPSLPQVAATKMSIV